MGEYWQDKFPEKYYGMTMGIKDKYYKTIAAGAWNSDNKFYGMLYAIDDYKGTLKMQLTFSGDNICVFMSKAAERFFDNYQGTATGWAEK